MRDYDEILDTQIQHLSRSTLNLMDEFHEHWRMHVAEFVYNHTFSVYSLL